MIKMSVATLPRQLDLGVVEKHQVEQTVRVSGLDVKVVPRAHYHHLVIDSRKHFGWVFRENMNASKSSEHPPVRGENIKTFRWNHRLQRQNLFMAFKRVPQW